jgi:hypothetical protein
LNEFDLKLVEDGETNKLDESVQAFQKVCKDISSIKNDDHDPELVLILTKKDLFRLKIEVDKVPFKDHVKGYKDPNQYEPCLRFITQMFTQVAYENYVHGGLSHVFVTNSFDDTEIGQLFERGLVPLAQQVINRTSNPTVPSQLQQILSYAPGFNVPALKEQQQQKRNSPNWTKLFVSDSESSEVKPPQHRRRLSASSGTEPTEQNEETKIKNLSIQDKYKLVKLLARGGQGAIYLVERNTLTEGGRHQVFVMKRMELKNGNLLNQSFDEIKNLYHLNGHKNICNIVDFFMDIKKRSVTTVAVVNKNSQRKNTNKDMDDEDHMYVLAIVMEHCQGGDMRSYLAVKKKEKAVVQELVIVQWVRQIVDALMFVHNQGLIHRDLKPEVRFSL